LINLPTPKSLNWKFTATLCGWAAGNLLGYGMGSLFQGRPLTPDEFLCNGRTGQECTAYAGTSAILDFGFDKLTDSAARNRPGVKNLPNNSGKPRNINQGVDDFGRPCFRVGQNTLTSPFDYLFAFFRPISVSACGNSLQLIADHAWGKHKDKFPGLSSANDLKNYADSIMKNPTESYTGASGKTYYWNADDGTILIVNPHDSKNGGSIFKPDNGYDYYLDQIKYEESN